MENLNNRMETPQNRQGRPAATARQPAEPAEVVMPPTAIPPMRCPYCGRNQHPRANEWGGRRREDFGVSVSCRMCGKKYVYTPPTVRKLENQQ
jgi:hypothetical protein